MRNSVVSKTLQYLICRAISAKIGDPNGIRTRVTPVKGECPRPLDDRVKGVDTIDQLVLRFKLYHQEYSFTFLDSMRCSVKIG